MRVLLESVVERDNVENVQQLTLVLVNAFHLHVKQRCRINRHFVLLLNVRCKLHLVLLYNNENKQQPATAYIQYKVESWEISAGNFVPIDIHAASIYIEAFVELKQSLKHSLLSIYMADCGYVCVSASLRLTISETKGDNGLFAIGSLKESVQWESILCRYGPHE